jgi:hypothetical protein
MSALAMILVVSAHITAAQNAPDLPDDFGGTGEVAAAVPTITFETVAQSAGGLVRSSHKVTERWLVSEQWCANCPAAKARFRAAGNPDCNILTIAEAKRRHGKTISSVPTEYTTTETVEAVQPPSYRSESAMVWRLNGSSTPLKTAILKHLRGGDQHLGKHWQQWHLESWKTQQLYALHDDDHAGTVPTFDDAADQAVIATVAGADGSAETLAAVLSEHLIRSSGQEPTNPVYGGLFDFSVSVDQSWKDFCQRILSAQKISFPAAGLTIDWTGPNRTFAISPNKIAITPPVKVSVSKWIVTYSAALNGAAFTDGLSSVTLDLSGAPDITINLVSK